jgi:malonate-semialdehyde dehydrogenase (acetylating) / methylmalonate-semialdehyde dehydrogenase
MTEHESKKQKLSPQTLQNYVGNAFVPLASGSTNVQDAANYVPVTSPATGSVIAYSPLSKKADVDAAVLSASKAFETWSNRTVKDRAQIIIRFHALVVKHADELADLIVLEHGKVCEFL